MSRLSKDYVYQALDIAANHIREAAGEDGITSRRDMRQKLNALNGAERDLADIFYRFMDHRDSKKGARITESDIVDTLAYAKENLVEQYDLNRNGLSKAEIEAMSTTGQLAVRLARKLKKAALEQSQPSPEEMKQALNDLSTNLRFASFGSEGEGPVKGFYAEGNITEINEQNIQELLNLDFSDVDQQIDRIIEVEPEVWIDFIDLNTFFGYGDEAEDLKLYMEANLTGLRGIILGLDNLATDSTHRTLVVGITSTKDLAGFETEIYWT